MSYVSKACVVGCVFLMLFAGYVYSADNGVSLPVVNGVKMLVTAEHSGNAVGNDAQKSMVIKIINLAKNTLILAQGYVHDFSEGENMFLFSKEYFEKAVRMYQKGKFKRALEYALASFNVSRAIIHAYLAYHLGSIKY